MRRLINPPATAWSSVDAVVTWIGEHRGMARDYQHDAEALGRIHSAADQAGAWLPLAMAREFAWDRDAEACR